MNPFLISGPAIISFSGGRTSAYMLWRILQAHGGTLPPNLKVTFANTGKERLKTLNFVLDCEVHWGVKITWLEWRDGEHGQRFLIVNHETASRNGEPFKALIEKKRLLPNPVTRFCTSELKVRVMRDYARSLGWEAWTNIVGLRADEPGRVARALDPEKTRERWTNACPLSDAGVDEEQVLAFWKAQNFDLQLKSYEGNCDLCFLKGMGKVTRIMLEKPDLADWWVEAETWVALAGRAEGHNATFRSDRPSYRELLDQTRRQGVLPFVFFDDNTSCDIGCTDQEPESDLRELSLR